MANIPPIPPQVPQKIDDSKPSSPNPSTEKTTRVSRSIFDSLQQGITQIKAIFTPSSRKSSPKLPSPSLATSLEEYETYLDDLLLKPAIRDISQEELLDEGMGTQTFEELINQIIKDLKRHDVILLNREPLKLETSDDESIREIKNQLITASTEGRIVGLLHQGIHASLTTNPAHEELSNFDLTISPLAATEKEQSLLGNDSLKKIELIVKKNGTIALTVSEPIALVRVNEDGDREVLHYISVKGHYEDGRITTTFTKVEPFEEIRQEDVP